jgi:hypothetical protein
MFTRLSLFTGLLAVGTMMPAGTALAATMTDGDVTANLSGDFFVDDASLGGNDLTITNASSPRTIGPRNWDLDSSGAIDAGDLVAGTVTVTGFGFASNASTSNNSATSLTIEFVYLGADGVVGGGDDVSLGSESVTKTFNGASQYYVNFDTPLSAAIDGANNKFASIIDTDGTGNIVIKRGAIGDLEFEPTFGGPKISVSGSFVPVPEPSSLALLGLGGLLIARRRRG